MLFIKSASLIRMILATSWSQPWAHDQNAKFSPGSDLHQHAGSNRSQRLLQKQNMKVAATTTISPQPLEFTGILQLKMEVQFIMPQAESRWTQESAHIAVVPGDTSKQASTTIFFCSVFQTPHPPPQQLLIHSFEKWSLEQRGLKLLNYFYRDWNLH